MRKITLYLFAAMISTVVGVFLDIPKTSRQYRWSDPGELFLWLQYFFRADCPVAFLIGTCPAYEIHAETCMTPLCKHWLQLCSCTLARLGKASGLSCYKMGAGLLCHSEWWCTLGIYAAYGWTVDSLNNSGFIENVFRNWFHMTNYIICSIFKTCI